MAVCRDNLDPAEVSPHLVDDDIRFGPARFEHYRLIAGHFSVLTQTGFCRGRYSMTLLRNPIRRIFSAYAYWRAASELNPLTSKAKALSFTDFVRHFMDSPLIIHNPYLHHFAAIGRDCSGYPSDTSTLLAAAKHNLAAFDFVGICEEFERSSQLLCRELGWRFPAAVPHHNRTWSENSFAEIESQTLGILQDRNQLDFDLYEYAVQLFHAREASAGAKSDASTPGFGEPDRFVPFQTHYRGNRRATIRSVSATWIPDESSRTLAIAVRFATTAPIAKLNWGVQVNDALGNVVWGTNTTNENLDLDHEMGCDCRAAFLVECELPPGEYFVTVELSEPRKFGFHEHWIDHAACFSVAPRQVTNLRRVRRMQLQRFWSVVDRNPVGGH